MVRTALSIALAAATLAWSPAPVHAASCYDLWYARNLIFAQNGYCFRSRLGRRTFGNGACYTDNPRLSRADQRRVARLKRQERRQRCRMN